MVRHSCRPVPQYARCLAGKNEDEVQRRPASQMSRAYEPVTSMTMQGVCQPPAIGNKQMGILKHGRRRKGIKAYCLESSRIPLVPPARFERATTGLGIRCSILLSYGGVNSLGPKLPVRESYLKAGVFARGFPCKGKSLRPDALLVLPVTPFSPGRDNRSSPSWHRSCLAIRSWGRSSAAGRAQRLQR